MKEICIPFSRKDDFESAELEIRLSGSSQIQHYRLESVDMKERDSLTGTSTGRVERLKQYISAHSSDWELIQILDSQEGANYIYLLYRKK